MPSRPKRPCAQPGCSQLVSGRPRCELHSRQHTRQRRQSGGSRPYDKRAWRDRVRPAHLRREPLCRFCLEQGRTEVAVDVDHIDSDPWNNAPANLRSLCRSCHSRRTSVDQVHGAPQHPPSSQIVGTTQPDDRRAVFFTRGTITFPSHAGVEHG